MEVLKTSQEIVHEGWLIKSPPTKLWRARWRKRWFALRHSGELPGQYFLEYYTDKRCRKLKGHIDLDQCEQVDAGLRFENRKQKYQYMFNVKTPKRIYYLVAESESDMNKWVDAICQVCGLKAYTQDEEQQLFHFESQESPPISPTSTISGPYIPISECISGRRLNDTSSLSSAISHGPEHYDAPRRLAPSPSRSPTTTDAESVFTDDEWTTPIPSVNWETFPSSGDSRPSHSSGDAEIGSWSVRKRFGKLRIVDSAGPPVDESVRAPPRPPKPSHMTLENIGHNYLNLDGATESSKPTTPATPAPSTPATAVISDETYDFPRSHQLNTPNTTSTDTSTIGRTPRHCYSNAAPSSVDDRVFRYDFNDDEPSSPRSESSTTATYSNLPSPLVRDSSSSVSSTVVLPPPVVYRELKPGRKMSDTTSIISNEPSPGPNLSASEMSPDHLATTEPPRINRKLKPPLTKIPTEGPLQLASPPGKNKFRAAPSPTPHAHGHGTRHYSTSDEDNNIVDDKEEIYYYQDHNTFIPASNRRLVVLQYLDLDLEASESFSSSTLPPAQSPPNTTVYKTVDFLKTDAFNRTRQRVEEERKRTDELA
ncbi:GRB2-associated-binding protein 2 [Microplitis mediator]|uniref:GRB2-associated-binding protein 2 n=1 Tax=Microplitis mediator TaxID=375433 RepID=UPI002556C916|nr:GRB2-associated-binding protein 2 [Microplitis mediator]XP_057330707.1 GRB2-associated-binding protein 2 [Microplitis mediator]